MEDLKKHIKLENLPEGLSQAIREQADFFSDFSVTAQGDEKEADAIICQKDGQTGGAVPRLQLNISRKLRMKDILVKLRQIFENPALYVEDINLGAFIFMPQEKQLKNSAGEEIALTDKESEILYYLVRNSGREVSRDIILADVWNYRQGLDTHTLETHIYRLRQKLEQISGNNQILVTTDKGYNLNPSKSERGNIVTYILGAIFLAGVLMAVLSKGTEKSLDSTHIERDFYQARMDIETIHAAISECAQVYPERVDNNHDGNIDLLDNPTVPFPLYDDLSYGATGEELLKTRCPAAPESRQMVFNDDFIGKLSVLSDVGKYDTRYYNDMTEGVYIRIRNLKADELWKETAARLNDFYASCSMEIVSDAAECSDGCIYYWIVRPQTSTIGDEADCH